MIKTTKLVSDFDREVARFNTGYSKKLNLIDKLAILNKAQNIVVDYLSRFAEIDSRYRNILRPIEKKEVSLTLEKKEEKYNIYQLPKSVVKTLRQRAVCEKGECGTKEIPITLMQTDDLDRARRISYWKSDFAWEQILGDEGDGGLYVWHEGDFGINKVFIDYIRKPQELHAPTLKEPNHKYIDWNGEERTEDQDCELEEGYVEVYLVNVAAAIAKATLNDAGDYQLKVKEILEAGRLATA